MNKSLATRQKRSLQISIDQLSFSEYVCPGDTVTWGQCAAEPLPLTERLMKQRHTIGGRFSIFVGATWSETLQERYTDAIDFRSYCGAASNRTLASAGVLDILPCHYSDFGYALGQGGPSRVDVLLLQVAPQDQAGDFSLSIAHEYLVPLIDSARVVIAEVNDRAPWTYGNRTLRREDIDVLIHTSRSISEGPAGKSGPVESQIARNVAALVQNGSTLQTGIGGLPETILYELADHRELGIHTGALCDAHVELHERGALTNARKEVDTGVSVAGVMMGGARLRDFTHRNSRVQFRETAYTHALEVISRISRFVAINSAIEVDLTGQVNAEMAAGRYVGAVGGAIDFMRAAHRSRDGLSIIALPSRAGPHTRLVTKLSGPVSTPRSDTNVIVTEYGYADLRGLSVRQRIERIVAIAHPDDRDMLLGSVRSTVGDT